MFSRPRRTLLWVVIIVGYTLPTPAEASSIDTTALTYGLQHGFGAGGVSTYGQTFTVSGSDTYLDSFSLFLADRTAGSGTLDLRGYVAEWNGVNQATNILFESSTQTMNATGLLQEFAFDPNINLVSATSYVVFLSISNLSLQSASTFAMPVVTNSAISPGNFVSRNNGLNFAGLTSGVWTNFNSDAYMTASLTEAPQAVPEIGTGAMLLPGLILIGYAERRRRSARKPVVRS